MFLVECDLKNGNFDCGMTLVLLLFSMFYKISWRPFIVLVNGQRVWKIYAISLLGISPYRQEVFFCVLKFKSCDFGGCLQNVISYVQKIQALEMFSLCYWRYYYNESTSVCLHLIRTRAGLNS